MKLICLMLLVPKLTQSSGGKWFRHATVGWCTMVLVGNGWKSQRLRLGTLEDSGLGACGEPENLGLGA